MVVPKSEDGMYWYRTHKSGAVSLKNTKVFCVYKLLKINLHIINSLNQVSVQDKTQNNKRQFLNIQGYIFLWFLMLLK